MATITASDSTPESVVQAINLTTASLPANTATGYNSSNYPASPALTYYISVEKSGSDSLVSPVFTPSALDGSHVWPSVIIPSSGSWTAHIRLTSDDSSVANTSITAS